MQEDTSRSERSVGTPPYLILTIALMVISIPLSLFLFITFEISGALMIFSMLCAPTIVGIILIMRAINKEIGRAYLSISGLKESRISKSILFARPTLFFHLLGCRCELTHKIAGNRYFTVMMAQIRNAPYLRAYPYRRALKVLKQFFCRTMYVHIDDEAFESSFLVESEHAAFAKKLFSGEPLRLFKEINIRIAEVRVKDGYLFVSLIGVWLKSDEYADLIRTVKACLRNLFQKNAL